MEYKLIQRGNPGDKTAPKKWYASPVISGKTTQATISKEISGRSSLTRGDISNVIMNLIDELPKSLLEGRSVKLDGFGTFRVSFSSEGADAEKDFEAHMIRNPKIVFTPSKELKQSLANLTFERKK